MPVDLAGKQVLTRIYIIEQTISGTYLNEYRQALNFTHAVFFEDQNLAPALFLIFRALQIGYTLY